MDTFSSGTSARAPTPTSTWAPTADTSGVKEPENDFDRDGHNTGEGISSAQKSYITKYLNDADGALRGSSCQSTSWTNYIDQNSAVDYYIAMEFMKPVDGNMWASVYMYKPRGGKLNFGPMWDFDLAAGSANRAGNVVSSSGFYLRNNLGVSAQQSSNTWFNCLNKRSSFRASVKARWNAIKNDIDTNSFIDTQSGIISSSANTSYSSAPSGASHSYRISQYQTIKSSWSSDVSYLRELGQRPEELVEQQLLIDSARFGKAPEPRFRGLVPSFLSDNWTPGRQGPASQGIVGRVICCPAALTRLGRPRIDSSGDTDEGSQDHARAYP